MAPIFGPSDRTCGLYEEIGRRMTTRVCLYCRKPYEALTAKSLYCSGRCRAAASRGRRASGQADREARVRGLLAEALRELGGKEEA